MNIRGVGRTILGLALVWGVAACDDNPISEGRDAGEYFSVNPSDAAVEAGDTTRVIAIVMNRYGTPTNENVTAEPCDNKVTATADPARTEFESPETFLVIGQTLGFSCIVVRGGGLVDTATIRVVPAELELAGDTLLLSGEAGTVGVSFLNVSGQVVTGFDINSVTFSSGAASIATVDESGNVTAFAPGVAPLIVTLKNTWGVARVDTLMVRVQAGTFAGTFSPTNPVEGEIMTINAGVLAFDADTEILYDGVEWPWVLSQDEATITMITPPSGDIVIASIGENQVALNATIPLVQLGPEDSDVTTARVLAETDSMWFSVGGNFSSLRLAKLVVPANATYEFDLDWLPHDGHDLDIIFFNSAGAFMGYGAPWGGCATGAHPEACNVAIPAGTWYVAVNLYDGEFTTAKLNIKKQ